MPLILIAMGLNHGFAGPGAEIPNVNPPYGALGTATNPYALMTAHTRPYGIFGDPTKPYGELGSS